MKDKSMQIIDGYLHIDLRGEESTIKSIIKNVDESKWKFIGIANSTMVFSPVVIK